MKLGDIIYIIALVLFIWITFVIIRNYYRSKFNEKGQRLDMLDQYEENSEEKPDA
jgi:ribose 5-phosphate isomerase RpiB